MNQFDSLITQTTYWLTLSLFIVIGIVVGMALLYLAFQWYRYRNREAYSLGFVLLVVRVPRDYEI